MFCNRYRKKCATIIIFIYATDKKYIYDRMYQHLIKEYDTKNKRLQLEFQL